MFNRRRVAKVCWIFALGFSCCPSSVSANQPPEPDFYLVEWDMAANIMATMQAPCEGGECDAAVNALAIQVAEQITLDMEPASIEVVRNLDALIDGYDPDELAHWNSELPTSVSEVLDQILSETDAETDEDNGYKPGAFIFNGVADSVCGPVAWLVNVERTGTHEFRVRVRMSGDCACEELFGTSIADFAIVKTRYFRFEEPDPEQINTKVYSQATDRMNCWLRAQCPCANETEEDAPADQDLDAGLIWEMTVNPGQKLAKSRETVCIAGQPCTREAMPKLRELVEQVIAQHNTDRVLTFNQGTDESVLLALMRNAGSILDDATDRSDFFPHNYTPRLHYAGAVPSPCGSAPFEYELTITLIWLLDHAGGGLKKALIRTDFFLYGECDCDPGLGQEQLRDLQYKFHLHEFLEFDDASGSVTFEEQDKRCEVRANCYCPVEQDADPVPLGGEEWVISWDSADHCTYGGGTTTFWLPGAVTGGPLATPVPYPFPAFPTGFTVPGAAPSTTGPGNTPGSTILTTSRPDNEERTETTSTTTGPESLSVTSRTTGPPQDETQESQQTTSPPVETGEPTDEPPPAEPLRITVKATDAALEAGANVTGAQGMLTFAPEPNGVPGESFAEHNTESGASEGENSHLIEPGETTIPVSAALAELLGNATLNVDITPTTGNVLRFDGEVAAPDVLPDALLDYVKTTFVVNGDTYIATSVPTYQLPGIQALMDSTNAMTVEVDICVDPKPLSDPLFSSAETWSQPYADQWGVQRVGFTNDDDSAWSEVNGDNDPVIIAVIDSGLDWNHLEIPRNSLWQNPGEIPANGLDDDGNGYADDMIGWDFWDNDRKPWDVDGHGTFVAGVMFADADNRLGIAGISRNAKLMVLKAMNAFGHSRASKVAQAILYAVDNGARVINLSLGGPGNSTVVAEAIRYAYENDVVVVVAAGNEATPAENQVVAGVPNALTVAATNVSDQRSIYSNYGAGIDVAAPGDDILSLRARRTDLLLNIPGVDYEAESAFVGRDRRYYRASGTSFAAPIVAGVAGLVIANNPDLSAKQVMRIIRQSAQDIETPGVDHFTGYGLVDAVAALRGDPEYFINARIEGVELAVENGKQHVRVLGQADANQYRGAELMIGAGAEPAKWSRPSDADRQSNRGVLGRIPAGAFVGAKQWTVRLLVTHKNGSRREFRFLLNLG